MNLDDDDDVGTSGKRIPTGWRVGVFKREKGLARQVSAPRWSQRPPKIESESWVLAPKM